MESEAVIYANLSRPFIPLWGVALILATVLPAAAILGYLSGRRTYVAKGYAVNPPSSIPGETTIGALLALLGLLIAFTYGFAINWGDTRTKTVTEEAAALGTAFLRADLLEEPGRSDLRELLYVYSITRDSPRNTMASRASVQAQLEETLAAQARLWPTMMEAFTEDTPPPVRTFVAGGITDVLDAHTRRIAALSERVPLIVKGMIIVGAAGAVFLVANNAALRGRRISWRTFLFMGLLGVVMYLISDIERPEVGINRINTDSIRAASYEMKTALDAEAQQ